MSRWLQLQATRWADGSDSGPNQSIQRQIDGDRERERARKNVRHASVSLSRVGANR